MQQLILTTSYFDGHVRHTDGPFALLIEDGRVRSIERAGEAELAGAAAAGRRTHRAEFVMPGLVEAHAHIFLDGGELDTAARSRYLDAPFETMVAMARRNLAEALNHGVTLIRDAGDRYGVNHAARAESCRPDEVFPALRSPGLGIRRPGRYGGFLAHEANDDDEIVAIVDRIAEGGADDIKIILTGIIDFASGTVKGEPQFDVEALSLILRAARARGLKTFAHCSGSAGLEVAVAAGVDSIEHGFFMTRDLLARMAEKGIAWVPTFSPVHFQWAHPEFARWDAATVGHLRRILDAHLEHVARAHEMGVPLVAGSDAGSHGVCHGRGLLDDLFFFLEAGLPLAAVLESATSRPRRLWGVDEGLLQAGAPADLVLLAGDPFQDHRHLRENVAVFRAGRAVDPAIAAHR